MSNSFFNVESDVENDLNNLKISKQKLADAEERLAALKASNASEIETIVNRVKEYRAEHQRTAQPVINRLDDVGMGDYVYKKIISAVGDSYNYINFMLKNETKEFGYVSKNSLSIKLSLDALQSEMMSGRPFKKEYDAVRASVSDIDSDLEVWNDVATTTAVRGAPQADDVSAAAIRLAYVIQDVKQHEDELILSRRSLGDRIKYALSFTINPSEASRKEKEAQDFSRELIESVKQEKWANAIETADKAAFSLKLHTYTGNPLDDSYSLTRDATANGIEAVRRYSPSATYAHFRQTASTLVALQQFNKYCSASLTMNQYHLAETFFN
eukprot:Tbor_TRINITY_DN5729_c1_g1::TRINITY_DN5729_c1_g1_i1::g.19681::m.19681